MPLDVVALAQDLIRRPSVTPADAGAMDVLEQALAAMGFDCRRMKFGDIENLYARLGTQGPNLCFAGHTDVVPVGDDAAWQSGPFDGEIRDGVLYGRGAVDMKGAVAAFAAAVSARLEAGAIKGSVSFLITGDEEGPAIDGTDKIVRLLQSQGEVIDHCVLGEPTSSKFLGDQVKIGRRGSLNATIEVTGKQGHVAYPHLAANPVPVLVKLLAYLSARVLDDGHPQFPASNLEITTVDVGNTASNVIPAKATAHVNIRFNPLHDGESLSAWLEEERQRAQEGFEGTVTLTPRLTGNAFITEPGPFVEVVSGAIKDALGHDPVPSTTGGISDARFIRAMCPVVEVGLVGATMHAVDECTPVRELRDLQTVYERLIDRYFKAFR